MTESVAADQGKPFVRRFAVRLEGTAPLLFDRFHGTNEKDNEGRAPADMIYREGDGVGAGVVLPAKNVRAMFSAQKRGAIYRFASGKFADKAELADWFSASVQIVPPEIPITRGDEPIRLADVKTFNATGVDEAAGLRVVADKACVIKSTQIVPIAKRRVELALPWGLAFVFEFYALEGNPLTPEQLKAWLGKAGLIVALGTYRPVYGRFKVARFEEVGAQI